MNLKASSLFFFILLKNSFLSYKFVSFTGSISHLEGSSYNNNKKMVLKWLLLLHDAKYFSFFNFNLFE